MEYTNIISLVPVGEHFDAAAINEGVWLSQAHLDALETTLAENGTVVTAITSQRDEQALLAQQANEQIAEQQRVNDGLQLTVTAMEAEIADLKKGPAAPVQQTSKDADAIGADKKTFNHPVNEEANRLRVMQGKQPVQY